MSFDAEQQRRTQLMMAALANQGTVDELGLGPVRDLISGVLHPGLSVLHTRAKYLLFLPQIYVALAGTSPEELVKTGRRKEGTLAGELEKYYRPVPAEGRGIIGRNTREHAKQPASQAYWPLLRSLGIVRTPGSVSEYCRQVAAAQLDRQARSTLRSEDDLDVPETSKWIELPAATDFTGFELDPDEAEWIRHRFRARESLVAHDERSVVDYLLDPARKTWVADVPKVWDHPESDRFPSKARAAMALGRDLDRLVDGARIVYNYLCADRRPDHGEDRDAQLEKYSDAMSQWREETEDELPGQDFIEDLDGWVATRLSGPGSGLALARWGQTVRFLRHWHRVVASADDMLTSVEVSTLVTERETSIKPGRARLAQPDRLRSWAGDSGFLRFDYNWAVARRLLSDIHAGLGTEIVDFDSVELV